MNSSTRIAQRRSRPGTSRPWSSGGRSEFAVQGAGIEASIARADLEKDLQTVDWFGKFKNLFKITELRN